MVGGEQQTSRQRPEGGDGTDGIFKGDEHCVAGRVDHGQTSDEGADATDAGRCDEDCVTDVDDHEQISGEGGSTDDGHGEDDAEVEGENSSYDGDLRRR